MKAKLRSWLGVDGWVGGGGRNSQLPFPFTVTTLFTIRSLLTEQYLTGTPFEKHWLY